MSVGVLVIEAGEYSGTRITARCALEQGCDVFAVLGNVTNKNAWRPDTLIKQGANLTATGEDVGRTCRRRPSWSWRRSWRYWRAVGGNGGLESKVSSTASLFNETGEGEAALPRHEQAVMRRLRHDEAMQLNALIEGLGELASPQTSAALFELDSPVE
jgi:DNA processing protein